MSARPEELATSGSDDRVPTLPEIEAALGAATPGPWSQGMVGDRLISEVDYSAAFGWVVVDGERGDDGNAGLNDAHLIAYAPEWLAYLLNRVKEAEARIASEGDLTFNRVAEANRQRCLRWHDEDTEPWTGADWSNAMNGEAGEAANVVKKLRRHETRTSGPGDPDEPTLRAALAHEIADTILYAFLLADHYSIDVGAAVVEKFNIVSERQGFPDRLAPTPGVEESPE